MVVKLIISFSEEENELLDALASSLNVTRNQLVKHICRKHFGLGSIVPEGDD